MPGRCRNLKVNRKILLRPFYSKKQPSFDDLIINEEIYLLNSRAQNNYKPQIYSGDIITFWASRDPRFSTSEQLSWSNIATGCVKCYEFPRKHIMHVINGPYCKKIVEILRVRLDEAQDGISRKNN